MALGSTHRKFNIFTCVIYSGLIGLFTSFDWEVLGCFLICFVFGTFILSPDIDLGPNKHAGLSKLFIYPYSLFFKHRGISHSIFLGTLSRVVYAVILLAIIFLVSDRFNFSLNLFNGFIEFGKGLIFAFDYQY